MKHMVWDHLLKKKQQSKINPQSKTKDLFKCTEKKSTGWELNW